MLNRFIRAIADYTVGTAIVLVHLTLAERVELRHRLLAARAR